MSCKLSIFNGFKTSLRCCHDVPPLRQKTSPNIINELTSWNPGDLREHPRPMALYIGWGIEHNEAGVKRNVRNPDDKTGFAGRAKFDMPIAERFCKRGRQEYCECR